MPARNPMGRNRNCATSLLAASSASSASSVGHANLAANITSSTHYPATYAPGPATPRCRNLIVPPRYLCITVQSVYRILMDPLILAMFEPERHYRRHVLMIK